MKKTLVIALVVVTLALCLYLVSGIALSKFDAQSNTATSQTASVDDNKCGVACTKGSDCGGICGGCDSKIGKCAKLLKLE